MDIQAAFPSMAKGKLVCAIRVKQTYGDIIQLTETILSESRVEMMI